jgi:hypothetical protein
MTAPRLFRGVGITTFERTSPVAPGLRAALLPASHTQKPDGSSSGTQASTIRIRARIDKQNLRQPYPIRLVDTLREVATRVNITKVLPRQAFPRGAAFPNPVPDGPLATISGRLLGHTGIAGQPTLFKPRGSSALRERTATLSQFDQWWSQNSDVRPYYHVFPLLFACFIISDSRGSP